VSPEVFRLNGCITVQDNHLVIGGAGGTGEALVIPLPSNASPTHASHTVSPDVVSISCQTDEATALHRSMSAKEESALVPPVAELSRSLSMREDVKLKDINLKTSDAHQEKDKGGLSIS
jgi:hypothetical protein